MIMFRLILVSWVVGFGFIFVSCGVKTHSDDNSPPSLSLVDLTELKLDAAATLSDKTQPNPGLQQPLTQSSIQSYRLEAASDMTIFFQERSSAHACEGGSHFEGPLVSISKPDGSMNLGEVMSDTVGGLHQYRLQAGKGTNKFTIQFNSDVTCSFQTEFMLTAGADMKAVGAVDKALIGKWSKWETNHSHKISALINIDDVAIWTSKVSLNDELIYDIDYIVKANTNVIPHQLELTAKSVRKPSKQNPERVGDQLHCIYEVSKFAGSSDLKVYCLAKNETFYPTMFPVELSEIYHSGDAEAAPLTLFEKNDLNLTIPDASSSGVSTTFDVGDDVVIGDLSVFVSIRHKYLGEVRITIVDPQGNQVVFNPESQTSGQAIFGRGGVVSPDLIKLRGKSAKGRWTLKFTDNASGDIGTVLAARVVNYRPENSL